jgi:hypothetical protein
MVVQIIAHTPRKLPKQVILPRKRVKQRLEQLERGSRYNIEIINAIG